MSILAVYREPFGFMPHVQTMNDGQTLLEMRNLFRRLPEDFNDRGVICLNGHPVPRALWGAVRPKAPAVTEITFHENSIVGGGDDGKNVFSIIASIALTLATGFIAGGGLLGKFGLGAAFGAGKIGALALAAGVSLAGSLLLSALVPPPTVSRDQPNKNLGAASADGNVLSVNGPIPRVVGTRKVYPPLAAEPLTYFSGPDEIVEACFVLSGPHKIDDIRVGVAEIDSTVDTEYEVREGWPGDPPVTLVRRHSRTEAMQAELRGHIVSDEDGKTLDTQTGGILTTLPQLQVTSTRDAPDEHQLQITCPQGLHYNASEDTKLRIPLRIRIRSPGGEWRNMPELHFQAAAVRQLRSTIRFVWVEEELGTPSASNNEGWVEARVWSPQQTIAPTNLGWAADPYFVGPSGDDYMSSGNLGSTRVRHVEMDRYTTTLFLDQASFPRGRYEIEVQRGATFGLDGYAPTPYTYNGVVWDFWGYQGSPGEIAMSRDGLGDSIYLLRSVSIWNETPLPTRDLAAIVIRARNRSVDRLSCLAGGYVRDWDGSGWNSWTTTNNPAPHLRDIYVGRENLDPVPLTMLDEDGLVDWRQACIDLNYTCNAIMEDQSVDDAARVVASCGYARPYMADIWGVVRDYDRSAESPMQIFTPRNMSGFQWTKGFARAPEGFRVNFPDASRDYDVNQISVFRPGSSDDNGRMEQINYDGLVHEQDAIRHAEYDQMQALVRGTFYSWDCAAESILCRRGDLVGVSHDMLSSWAGSARITEVELSGSGYVLSVRLDSAIPVASNYFMDDSPNLTLEENLSTLGLRSGIAIRGDSGTVIHPISSSDGAWVYFDPPVPSGGVYEDSLVAVGPIGREYLRLIVFAVSPQKNYEATIIAVDEAPELWN